MLTAATMVRGYVVSVRTLLTRGLAGPTWQVGVDEQGREGLKGSGAVIQFRDPTMDLFRSVHDGSPARVKLVSSVISGRYVY